jgi:hypothetical protein
MVFVRSFAFTISASAMAAFSGPWLVSASLPLGDLSENPPGVDCDYLADHAYANGRMRALYQRKKSRDLFDFGRFCRAANFGRYQ